jgi:hypothetical protein
MLWQRNNHLGPVKEEFYTKDFHDILEVVGFVQSFSHSLTHFMVFGHV